MNTITAVVTNISSKSNLNIVEFSHESLSFCMMSLELPQIKIGSKVELFVKSTHISLAKELKGKLSFSNQIKSKIVSLDIGTLLSCVDLSAEGIMFQSIITSSTAKIMNLKVGDEMVMLIKSSDLSIKKVLNE